MLIIFATIMCLTTPTGSLSPNSSLIYLGVFRIVLGIGVGGDYPMSASVTSDRANLRKRGTMLAYIFSNQGWGSFMGSIVFMIVLQCYRHVMETKGETSKVDGGKLIVIFVLAHWLRFVTPFSVAHCSRPLTHPRFWDPLSAASSPGGDPISRVPTHGR